MATPKEQVLAAYPKAASSKTLLGRWSIITPEGPDPDDPTRQLIRELGSGTTANLAWTNAAERVPEHLRNDAKHRMFGLNYGTGPTTMRDITAAYDPPDVVAVIDGARHEIRHKLSKAAEKRAENTAQLNAYVEATGATMVRLTPNSVVVDSGHRRTDKVVEETDEADDPPPVVKPKKYRTVQYVEPKPQKAKGAREKLVKGRKAERQARKKNRRKR